MAARPDRRRFRMRNFSALSFATGTVVLARPPASRALLRMVEIIGKRRVEVAPERQAFEVAFALGVEPGVEALQVDAAASDGPMAVKAVGAIDRKRCTDPT